MMAVMLIFLAVVIAAVLLLIMAQGARQRDVKSNTAKPDWLAELSNLDEVDNALHELTDAIFDLDDDADEVNEKPKHAPSLELAAGIRDMLDEGRKAEAIEIYQKFTGVDQYTAQAAVNQIERERRLSDQPDEGDGYIDEDDESFNSNKLSDEV